MLEQVSSLQDVDNEQSKKPQLSLDRVSRADESTIVIFPEYVSDPYTSTIEHWNYELLIL